MVRKKKELYGKDLLAYTPMVIAKDERVFTWKTCQISHNNKLSFPPNKQISP